MNTLLTLFTGTCFLLLFTFSSTAQSVAINNTGASPDASALLDLNTTDKGFLITRSDTLNIVSPAFGLMTLSPVDSCLYLYNGIEWIGMGGGGANCPCNIDTPEPDVCKASSFTDTRDNTTYEAVKIGEQCWMSEDLAYLPSVYPSSQDSQTSPRYYVFGYQGTDVAAAKNENNYTDHGVLYNWSAAMDGATSSDNNPSGVQGACPDGWHLPSDSEWKELEMFLGLSPADANTTGFRGTDHGNKLKESGTAFWSPGNTGTNTTGFSGRGNGMRATANGGRFYSFLKVGHWASATEVASNTNNMYRFRMDADNGGVNRDHSGKGNGYYIRCVQD